MYQVPEGFACVEDCIYRATHLYEPHVMFLETLSLKSILFLNLETPSNSLMDHCKANSITAHHHGIQPWRPAREMRAVGLNPYKDAIKITLDKTNYPLLVVDASCMFVGVLRRLQHWAFSSILAEYTSIAGPRANYFGELFLELVKPKCIFYEDEIDEEEEDSEASDILSFAITLPSRENLPSWFTAQHEMWLRLNKNRRGKR